VPIREGPAEKQAPAAPEPAAVEGATAGALEARGEEATAVRVRTRAAEGAPGPVVEGRAALPGNRMAETLGTPGPQRGKETRAAPTRGSRPVEAPEPQLAGAARALPTEGGRPVDAPGPPGPREPPLGRATRAALERPP
jgi:hypothetical protein